MIVRYREDPVSGGIMIGAVVLLAGTLMFMLFAPKPQGPTRAERIDAENKVKLATETYKRQFAEAAAYNTTKLWKGNEQQVTPAVFAVVNKFAKSRGLSLQALRPQRINDKTNPVQLPYTAVVDGPYTSVVEFAKDLETGNNRLAVGSVMVSSADAASDRVTASIGIVTYLAPIKTTTTPAPGAGTTTTKEKQGA